MNNDWSTPIHAYWDEDGQRKDVTDNDIRRALKEAATVLEYPETRGIPIDRVDTHSLRGGGANALSLNGYSDTQIQKLGRWRVSLLRNTSGMNSIHLQQACQRHCGRRLVMWWFLVEL